MSARALQTQTGCGESFSKQKSSEEGAGSGSREFETSEGRAASRVVFRVSRREASLLSGAHHQGAISPEH